MQERSLNVVPESAIWIGGPDGGVFVLVKKHNGVDAKIYLAKVYYVSGDIAYNGLMRLYRFRESTIEIYWLYAKQKLGFKLTNKQKNNRKLLSDTMVKAGFIPLSYEWWHFNGMSKTDARRRYKIIE